jgi:hypothetical protein
LVVTRPAAQTATAQIRRFTVVDARRGYAPGDTVKVRLLGTANGQANFDAVDIAPDVPMKEVRPGIYEGQFVVPRTREEKLCTLVGRLTVGNTHAENRLTQMFWIDPIAPAITRLAPAADSSVPTQRPTIDVRYTENGSGIDPATAKMLLDGKNVTPKLSVKTAMCGYEVPEPLAPGQHTVHFEIADHAGNKAVANWKFQVVPQTAQKIQYVRHGGAEPLARGEVLTVEVGTSEPGQRCFAEVGSLRIDLQPDAAGTVFKGRHTVAPADIIQAQTLVAHFVDQTGREFSMPADAPVTLRGDWPGTLQILSPTEGQTVKSEFKVVGQAKPGSTVRVTVTYLKKRFLVFQGELYQGIINADQKGKWETPPIDPDQPLIGLSDSYQVTAELLDAQGRVKTKAQVSLVGK